MQILRGLTPELHEATSNLLKQLPEPVAIELTERLGAAAPFWPVDLLFQAPILTPRPNVDQPPGRRGYNSRFTCPIIEAADRCGLLRDALVFLREHEQKAVGLLGAYDTITARLFTAPYIKSL
jgi:hypothetical protein